MLSTIPGHIVWEGWGMNPQHFTKRSSCPLLNFKFNYKMILLERICTHKSNLDFGIIFQGIID